MLVKDDHTEVKSSSETEGISSDEQSMEHVYCSDCYPKEGKFVAFCGMVLTYDDEEETYYKEGSFQCVVCVDLELTPCRGCGQ